METWLALCIVAFTVGLTLWGQSYNARRRSAQNASVFIAVFIEELEEGLKQLKSLKEKMDSKGTNLPYVLPTRAWSYFRLDNNEWAEIVIRCRKIDGINPEQIPIMLKKVYDYIPTQLESPDNLADQKNYVKTSIKDYMETISLLKKAKTRLP